MHLSMANLLPKSKFVRQVGILTGGTAFAQGLAVLALPILTRIYTPEEFSLLAVYIAIISLASVISSLRFNIAIPLPEHDQDAANLLVLGLAAATGVALFLSLALILYADEFVHTLRQPSIEPYLWMLPVGAFVASVYNVLQYWASRKKQFGLITRTRITRAVSGVGVQVGTGFTVAGPFGLLFGHMIYGGMGIFGLVLSFLRHDRHILLSVNQKSLRRNIITYRRFPLFSVPEALFNTGGIQLPIMLIAAYATAPVAGYVMLAMRIMGLPMGLVGSSVAQVYLSEAPARLRDGTLVNLTRTTMWTLFKTGGPLLILVGLAAPFLFPFIFGAEWERAGVILAWMTPWFILQFISSPISVVLHVTGNLFISMILQAVGLVMRIGVVGVAIWFAPDWIAEAFALSGAVFYTLYIVTIMAILKSESVKTKHNQRLEQQAKRFRCKK